MEPTFSASSCTGPALNSIQRTDTPNGASRFSSVPRLFRMDSQPFWWPRAARGHPPCPGPGPGRPTWRLLRQARAQQLASAPVGCVSGKESNETMTDILGRVVRGAWCVVRGAWCVVRGAWCVVRGAGKALPMHARGMQPENKKGRRSRGSRLQGQACRRAARSRQVLHRRLAKAMVSKRGKELDATTPACAVRRGACKEWREVSKMDMADRGVGRGLGKRVNSGGRPPARRTHFWCRSGRSCRRRQSGPCRPWPSRQTPGRW